MKETMDKKLKPFQESVHEAGETAKIFREKAKRSSNKLYSSPFFLKAKTWVLFDFVVVLQC